MSIRDNVEDSIARQEEWSIDNEPQLISPRGTEDVRTQNGEQWNAFEAFNEPNEEQLMSKMDMNLSRLNNYK